MAQFPALEPKTRSYNLGFYAVTEQPAWSTGAVRFRHGTTPQGHRLTLGYELLTATEAAQIRDHYRGQLGGLLPFILPSIIWAGQASTTGPVASGVLWRYASEPEETHRIGSLVDLSVDLEAVV